MNDTTSPIYSIEELATLTDLPRRTVRYYIQQGLVNRPIGEKRAAHYTTSHLEQLLSIRKWQSAGFSLDRIRKILANPDTGLLPDVLTRGPGTVEVWSHLVVADGVEITLEPGRAGLDQEQVRAFFNGASDLFEKIRQQGNDDAKQ
jgi:DNA-binding transcriptional MerR regulator